ncbi:hypothetical protein PR048_029117 [Dryococelus australis]|uniref:HTH CENPB-type domain-containing protein n=1 Tax=Dryococelus australis TaxID=614101 RepID=A0ABQ9GCG1_9NEOP|nr:hypothetical protein PR048_029117 [Dryococelus australis]
MGSKRKTLDFATKYEIIKKIQEEKRNRNEEEIMDAMEKALLAWFIQSRRQNILFTGPMIQEKANLFAVMLKIDAFKCSTGWLDSFEKLNGITWHKIVGESKAVTCGVEEQFYNLMPDCTLAVKGDTCKGVRGKRSKERFTVLLGANMNSSDKVTPFVFGKLAKPYGFKGNIALNVSAPITGRSFCLLITGQRIPQSMLRNTELVFLPPNTTRLSEQFSPAGMQSSQNTPPNCFQHAQFVGGKPVQTTEKVDDNPDCLPVEDDKVATELGDRAASPQPGTSAEPQPGISHDVLPSPALVVRK